MELSSPLISSATQRNWAKLNTVDSNRLTSRANKSRSQKRIAPESYIISPNIEKLRLDILNSSESLIDIIFSLCKIKLSTVSNGNPNVLRFLNEYQHCKFIEFCVPDDILADSSNDWLGYIYQSRISEGERNLNGQYYTSYNIVGTMVDGLVLMKHSTFLDPCCGGGAFLLNVNAQSLSQLFGIDNDEIAVMICKANLIAKYKNDFSYPQVYHADFLEDTSLLYCNPIEGKKFDYIYTNPPWGTSKLKKYNSRDIKSGERASLFIAKSFSFLNEGGEINFLLPSSILKIKVHSDIRQFLLQNTSINKIIVYKDKFNGVFTDFFSIKALKQTPGCEQSYLVLRNGEIYSVTSRVDNNQSYIPLNCSYDEFILKNIEAKNNDTLSHSTWALGIVTGDNKNKLKTSSFSGSEAIFTGKDISPYLLKSPTHFLYYDRSALQQCARDDIYRSPEKLVYKFISKSLCFAYDNSGSLFLNSANILIPQIEGMSIKTVMAFLNSELFSFFYSKRYSDIKILKGNLEEIPFPKISKDQDEHITKLVDNILYDRTASLDTLNEVIYSIYGFNEEIISYIKSFVYGNPA